MKKYLIAVLLLCLPCLAFQSIGRHVEPESCVQAQRILANSGTVVDSFYLNQVMRAIKDNNAYSVLVLATDPNIGVKLSGSSVTTLYDISPTNADGTATGANMPLYTLGYQNGHAAIGYNGTSNFLNVGSSTVYKSLSDMTIFSAFNPTVARVNEFVSNLSSGLKGYGFVAGRCT